MDHLQRFFRRPGARSVALGSRHFLKSDGGPGEQHNLAAEPASVDAGVDVPRRRERKAVDDDGMDGMVAEQNSVAMSDLKSSGFVDGRAVVL
jgi:hypothetical protein